MKSISIKAGARASLPALLLFLSLAMGGCSTIKYLANNLSGETGTVYRATIPPRETSKFLASIRVHQEDVDALYSEACYFQDHGKHKFALQNFRRIIEVDPSFMKAYNGMGVSYDMLGNHLFAIEAYRRALEIDPQADYVYNNLGYSYFLQGEMDGAIDAFRRAVSLDSENKKYHNNLGLAHARKGEPDKAYAEFKSGGDEAKAHYYLGKLYYDQGSYNQALNHLTKAVEAAPTMTEARRSLDAATAMAQIVDSRKISQMAPPDSLAGFAKNQTERVAGKEGRVMAINTLKQIPGSNENKKYKEAGLIEISNGNGINQMARKVGGYLNRNGFEKPLLTNASHFGFTETTIYYCDGYLQTAYQLAQSIPGQQNMEKTVRLDRPETKIKVRIGKDLIPYARIFETS